MLPLSLLRERRSRISSSAIETRILIGLASLTDRQLRSELLCQTCDARLMMDGEKQTASGNRQQDACDGQSNWELSRRRAAPLRFVICVFWVVICALKLQSGHLLAAGKLRIVIHRTLSLLTLAREATTATDCFSYKRFERIAPSCELLVWSFKLQASSFESS